MTSSQFRILNFKICFSYIYKQSKSYLIFKFGLFHNEQTVIWECWESWKNTHILCCGLSVYKFHNMSMNRFGSLKKGAAFTNI